MFRELLISCLCVSYASAACELVWVASSGVQRVPNAVDVLKENLNDHVDLPHFAYFARTGGHYGYVRSDQPQMTSACVCK